MSNNGEAKSISNLLIDCVNKSDEREGIYKETPVGKIPVEWEISTIRNIVDKISQIDPHKYPNRLYKYIDVSSVSNSSLKIENYSNISGKDAPSRARKVVGTNDIIFATIRPYLKRIALIDKSLNGQLCSTAFCIIRCKEHIADYGFVFQYITTDQFISKLNDLQCGSGYPAVSDNDIYNQLIPLPELSEQRKIASILSAVDAMIDVSDRIIAQTEQVKKGLLLQLLSKRSLKTAKEAPNNTNNILKYYRLNDLSELITKGTTPTTYGFDYIQSGINFIKVESIDDDGHFLPDKFAHINNETHQFLSRSILSKNDILFSIAGALGRVTIVTSEVLPANINQALSLIRIKKSTDIPIDFIKYYLQSDNIQNVVKNISVQSAQSNLSLVQIGDFEIAVPEKKECERITNILSLVDKKLFNERQAKEQIIILKQSLMRDLLNGRVRVKPDHLSSQEAPSHV